MTAETLRRAAALMRERAEAAQTRSADPLRPDGGSWVSRPHHARRDCHTVQTEGEMYLAHYVPEATADHIASWSPAVALAVANLLEGLAGDMPWDFRHDEALAVARTYLGEIQSFRPERGAE